MKKTQIKDLKKGSKFLFNDEVFIVTRKWLPPVGEKERPLIAKKDHFVFEEHRFYNEDLEVKTKQGP